MKVSGAWAAFEMERGELYRAKELADLHLAQARKSYDQSGSPTDLAKALRLKAMILRRLGLDDEANAALEEAETLPARPDACPEEGPCLCTQGMDGRGICNGPVPFFDCTAVVDGQTVCKRLR
jgi:hypothetical protein